MSTEFTSTRSPGDGSRQSWMDRPKTVSEYFGLDNDNKLALPVLIVGVTGVISALLLTGGDMLPAFALIILIAVVLLTFYKVEYGLYSVLAAVLVCDQHNIPGFKPPTFIVGYFQNLKESTFLPTISAGVLNLFELHLLFLFFTWFLVSAVRRRLEFTAVPSWGTAVLFFGWIAVAFARGMSMGGDFLPALWEVRALFYLCIMFFAVPQIIRTRRHVRELLWVCILAVSVKALQGVSRYVGMGFSTGGFPTLTNHEDAFFFAGLIVFLTALAVFRARDSQRRFLLLILPIVLLGFYVAQRRAAYAALFLMMPTLFLLLPGSQRWNLALKSIPIVLFLALYAGVFWNSESRFAGPLRLVKSGLSTDREEAGNRYYSNLYRDHEAYNLATTVRRDPVLGIGFGRKYDQPIPLVNIPFPLRDYIPHNEVLWLVVKTGAVGFFLFWVFVNTAAFRVSALCMRLKDPYSRAVCAFVICALAGQVVVSFYDLQFTFYRNMIYLGALLGTLPALQSVASEEKQAEET